MELYSSAMVQTINYTRPIDVDVKWCMVILQELDAMLLKTTSNSDKIDEIG